MKKEVDHLSETRLAHHLNTYPYRQTCLNHAYL